MESKWRCNEDGSRNPYVLVWTMKMEAEAQVGAWRKERIVPFFSVAYSASVEFTPQTSKCEPVLTEAQAEVSPSLLLSLVEPK